MNEKGANDLAELRAFSRPTGGTILVQRTVADYDQTHAVEMLSTFNRFLLSVVAQYEGNEQAISECDRKSSDLLHYIELHDDMNASEGYKTYRKLAEVRRERRISKNENELLLAVYNFIKQNPRLVSEISAVLGRTRAAKESIEKKIYSARTDII